LARGSRARRGLRWRRRSTGGGRTIGFGFEWWESGRRMEWIGLRRPQPFLCFALRWAPEEERNRI
jgi:hypothetical protein